MDKVGRLHVHELPDNRDLDVRAEVYKCFCGTEFFVEENKDSGFNKNPKKWVELSSSSYSVEYDKTVNGEKFIGRADKDTVFDEPNSEEVSDASEAQGDGSEVHVQSESA